LAIAPRNLYRVLMIGSRRFAPWFELWGEALRRAGHHPYQLPNPEDGYARERNEREKELAESAMRDEMEIAQKIFVLNACSYIGSSTLEQIRIAQNNTYEGRLVFLESWGIGFSSSKVETKHALNIPDNYSSPISTVGAPSPYDADLLGEAGPSRDRIVRMIQHFENVRPW
jgi:hypothetical protein